MHYFNRKLLPTMVCQAYGVGSYIKDFTIYMAIYEVVLDCIVIRIGDVLRDRHDISVAGGINNKSVVTLEVKQDDRGVVRMICARSVKKHCHSPYFGGILILKYNDLCRLGFNR